MSSVNCDLEENMNQDGMKSSLIAVGKELVVHQSATDLVVHQYEAEKLVVVTAGGVTKVDVEYATNMVDEHIQMREDDHELVGGKYVAQKELSQDDGSGKEGSSMEARNLNQYDVAQQKYKRDFPPLPRAEQRSKQQPHGSSKQQAPGSSKQSAWQGRRLVKNVILIRARVPVLKVTDCGTNIECDFSVENRDGIARSQIIFLIASIDERFRKLSIMGATSAHQSESTEDEGQ